ncbi:MAG: DUF4332 domain-containing protein [Bacteroidetes bacterium]|nr:DUF4332 domain-containing protein [Bacteroidota bacterium]
MCTKYYIDAGNFGLEKFRLSLESRVLIPSRMLLKEDLKARFHILESEGLHNLEDLLTALKSKSKVVDFSERTGLPVEYLTILKREAGSYFPNPIPLHKFSGIDNDVMVKLDSVGIRNSKQLFDQTVTNEKIKNIVTSTGLSDTELTPVMGLCDLSRLYGVGPVFAGILYNIGIDSVRSFVFHSAAEIVQMYEDVEQKRADFTEKDIQFALEVAQDLDLGA